MQEEAAVTQCKQDLARLDVFVGTGLNLDGIARPKSGQHAFPLNAQAHAGMGTVAAAQYVRH
jgi:hypothetical protein